MDYVKDIWAGYLQSFTTDASRPAALVIDFLLVAVLLYFILLLLNSNRGWRYLIFIFGLVASLIISSLFQLNGLHIISQALSISAVIFLPILFQTEFNNFFQGTSNQLPPSTASRATIIAASVIGSALLVILGSGVSTKTAELPGGVPIIASNLATGLSADFGSDRSATVVISASRQTWKGLSADDFSATVDVAKQPAGTYDLAVTVVSKVAGVEIRRISPKRVSVAVEPVIKKTVPVVVKFSGQAGDELVADTPVINPEKVEISGAKSVVNNLTQVVAPIDLDNQTATITQVISLVALDSNGQTIPQVSITPTEASITVPLVKSGKLKTVGIQATVSGVPAAGYWVKTVSLSPSVVLVTGNIDLLEALTSIATQQVSVAGLNSDKTIQVDLQLPSGITVADSTKKITAKITIERTSTTKSILPQLVYSGLDSSLKVTSTSPTAITALVSGSSSQLGSLNDGSVKITLDLSAFKSAGTYSITIKNEYVSLPDGIGLVSFLPSVINVTLESK